MLSGEIGSRDAENGVGSADKRQKRMNDVLMLVLVAGLFAGTLALLWLVERLEREG